MIDKTVNKVKSNGCIVIQDRIVEDINLNSTDKLVYGIIKALSNIALLLMIILEKEQVYLKVRYLIQLES